MSTRKTRQLRIRSKISGTAQRPRVALFRSNRNIYLQAIDDEKGNTLAASSDLKKEEIVNEFVKELSEKKIKKIVFDRSGYQYHGKIKNIAESLRKAGLEF